MGTISQKTKEQRALQKLRDLGFEVPEEMPSESMSDSMREGQAVLWYFETDGKVFKEKPCKWCGAIFAYCWNSTAIGYCSIQCMKLALQEIGLKWDPSKSPAERWGLTMPAVVPPEVLKMLSNRSDENAHEHPDLQEDLDETQVNLVDDRSL